MEGGPIGNDGPKRALPDLTKCGKALANGWRVVDCYKGSNTQLRWSTKRDLEEERSWEYTSRFETPWAKLEESPWTCS